MIATPGRQLRGAVLVRARQLLPLVPAIEAAIAWVNIEHHQAGFLPGGDADVVGGIFGPPFADALLVGGRIVDPVSRCRHLAVRHERQHGPAHGGVAKGRFQSQRFKLFHV